MNDADVLCSDRLLLDLIGDQLPPSRLAPVLDHVESCSQCQRRMEVLSANVNQWKKTADVLSDSDREGYPKMAVTLPVGGLSALSLKPAASISESVARNMLAPPSHPEMLGRLGRYEVECLIGSGGMGIVFKAFDTELNRPVAIKVLAPHLASCGSARQRFAREARAAAAVVNEHVVPIHNVETEGETPFLVMKYIDGESLQSRLDREGPLQVDEILRIGMQVAAGLAAAHQQGLVHRDIKPANILLEQGLERALITDFGLARTVDDANLTHSGFHVGTPQYMSPEQVSGHTVDCSSDLFSLGSVVYAMCTGRPPFRAENCFGVMKRIAEDTPRSIREINPRIPQWLECIVSKLLLKSPQQRLHSATETGHLFAHCLKHLQNTSSTPLPTIVRDWMVESSTSHKPAVEHGKLAKLIYSVFSKRRYVSIAVLVLLAVGVSAFMMRLDKSHIPESNQVTDPSIGRDAFVPQESTAVGNIDPTEQFDPDLEWDTAIRASELLRHEADRLEQRMMLELDKR